MKRPQFSFPHVNVRSLDFQTTLEIVAGGFATAILLRWLM